MKIHPDTPLEKLFRLRDEQKKALKRLRLATARDLLYHFPARYITVADVKEVGTLEKGDHALLYGKLTKLKASKAFRKKIPMTEGRFTDDSGSIDVVWFHQPYLAKMISEGTLVKLEGKVAERKDKLYLTNPEFERISALPVRVGNSLWGESKTQFSIPVYPESRGITSKWIYHAIQRLLKRGIAEILFDPIPQEIRKEYNLPSIKSALFWMHLPQKDKHSTAARKRFAFEEVFLIQLEKQRERRAYEAEDSFIIEKGEKHINEFTERFPFELTSAQRKTIDEILKDFSTPHAMSRLLEGDVGSGKTAVAASTGFAVVSTSPKEQDFGNLQVAYMAPTEILARQHFESFIEYFSHLPIQIGLITSSGCAKFPSKVDASGFTKISRTQLLKWVQNGEIAILIGTHSLIQKSVEFENLAYVIIDEQHRFGIRQRQKLQRKGGPLPHLLSMTATPIPRTLALTIYGDLDLSLLDEMPKGRKEVETYIVPPNKREKIYEEIRLRLEEGRQLYVICPRIDEPDPDKEQSLITKSVKEEAARLRKKVFPDYKIAELHGKLTSKKKEDVMRKFSEGEINILVATSVVEVGVNVPNATMIIIEGAERFGLAQLHQLRGRVQRSSHESFCYVFTDSNSKRTAERLKALKDAKNGFELAEYDLKLRGAGSLIGGKQWGITDVGMEALKNLRMVEAARDLARKTVKDDPELKKNPKLRELLEIRENIHFE